ncbi:hypothetical protein D0Y65_006572 [Glycine soja]|uniref:Lon N-terminal domain-containing protein n=1 Tax=Glycine soja TaxID=3848 RepID=A0A445L9A1_GLYSO|nr:hypothetical protein D0Y65_006572 [Glycine soja]
MLGVVGEAAPNDALELALFPLPLVLFPGAILPLQIFEFRYRIMMHRLLHTNLCFGVIYNNAISGTDEVSCVGEVIKHERLVDNRFFFFFSFLFLISARQVLLSVQGARAVPRERCRANKAVAGGVRDVAGGQEWSLLG